MSAILTVSQVNRYIASRFREDKKLRGILVSGEISNFANYARSGHLYFTLKDNDGAVKAVMFSNMASRLKFMPENGMRVIVSADVRVYERDGQYRLYVTDIQPDGAGALYLACEQLKERLSAEGLFDEAGKKPLPPLPKRIGIVTSAEGAALQDMLNVLSRRYPIAEITVYPAQVQGDGAPESICGALELADGGGMDVIICGRGGGSFEDLAAFNTETVARSLHGCKTPVISAVGHETDFSVADLAADLRAPTPSAAAELAVPDIKTLYGALDMLEDKLRGGFIDRLDEEYQELRELSGRLGRFSPGVRTQKLREELSFSGERLAAAYRLRLKSGAGQLGTLAAALDALSPLKTLARGYSLVYRDGSLVKSVKGLAPGDEISVRFADGTVCAETVKTEEQI